MHAPRHPLGTGVQQGPSLYPELIRTLADTIAGCAAED
jgi:ABC-type Zn2+ transport system substrate-binding protein/surface adhesin